MSLVYPLATFLLCLCLGAVISIDQLKPRLRALCAGLLAVAAVGSVVDGCVAIVRNHPGNPMDALVDNGLVLVLAVSFGMIAGSVLGDLSNRRKRAQVERPSASVRPSADADS